MAGNPFKILVDLAGLPQADHSGTGHKMAHNVTTIANIPLVAWLIYAVFSLRTASYSDFQAWMSQPINILAAILFVLVTLRHFTLELEIVFEDYVSDISARNMIIKSMKIFWFVLGFATIISILKFAL